MARRPIRYPRGGDEVSLDISAYRHLTVAVADVRLTEHSAHFAGKDEMPGDVGRLNFIRSQQAIRPYYNRLRGSKILLQCPLVNCVLVNQRQYCLVHINGLFGGCFFGDAAH